MDELEELEEAEAEALENPAKDVTPDDPPATTTADSESADDTVNLADGNDSTAQDVEAEGTETKDAVAEIDAIEEIGDDPMLREAGRIVTDLIKLTNGAPITTPLTAKATLAQSEASTGH